MVVSLPYQPTRLAETMNVAAAKPKSPRIEGAAMGCKNVCAGERPSSAAALASLLLSLARCVISLRSFLYVVFREECNSNPLSDRPWGPPPSLL